MCSGSVSRRIPIWQTNPDLFAFFSKDPAKAEHNETGWAIRCLIGRWLSLYCFLGGIVATYLVGVQAWNRWVALLAAWFMAITTA